MKIEIVKKLNDSTTIIINELANDKTKTDKIKKLGVLLKEVEEEFN